MGANTDRTKRTPGNAKADSVEVAARLTAQGAKSEAGGTVVQPVDGVLRRERDRDASPAPRVMNTSVTPDGRGGCDDRSHP